ncbi:glycosyltransferase family 4 protein [Thiomicrorhabdus cannonii]|uniref:glycosyltransferase family 4 protein n=1 Tax=Thiomicrorhabdus cannonii TaxID=2748011 RepID=UPI0015B8325C|nr:glycosyltransferase family 1 protein [Thiomicrorhabdus cannonii]
MKILIITDAWQPQTNGVVTTMNHVVAALEASGHHIKVLHPGLFKSLPLPGYAEVPIVWRAKHFQEHIETFAPDAVHIVTEGPLGWRARAFCQRHGWPFTTAFHTKFAEYLNQRLPFIPVSWGYRFLHWFHHPATRTLVSTHTLIDSLQAKGFNHLHQWNRGVDTDLFHPDRKIALPFAAPIHLYVGRVSVEKNLRDFLDLKLSGSQVVVGDGPDLASLQHHYPQAHFLGKKTGVELAQLFASADVFVFPSKTDTYGLVMLEALASGTPVAAYPATGPLDVINADVGALNDDLSTAIELAKQCDRQACRHYAEHFSWEHCAQTFLKALAPITQKPPAKNAD